MYNRWKSPGSRYAASTAAVVAVAAVLLAGCGSSDSTSSGSSTSGGSSSSQKDLKLGLSSASLQDPFQAILQTAVDSAAKQEGASVLPAANANNDASKQLSDVSNLLTKGATGLLIVPRDNSAVVPAITQAGNRKVPVVILDQAPAGGKVVITVRADNVGMGESACKQIGEAIGGKGKVLELQGDLATVNGRDRTDGFEKCMKAQYPGVQVIAKPTQWTADVATKATQTVLTANPDLKAIYAESDSVMLPGILSVLKRQGKLHPVGKPGHIVITTIDGTKLALDSIRNGSVDSVVSQPLPLYAKYGVHYLQQALAGKQPQAGQSDHDSKIVEVNGNLQDQLPAPVVTKSNVDDTAFWGNASG